jgi:hypothetical protein
MALDVAVYSTTLPGGSPSRLGVNMRTLIIIASLAVVLPAVVLTWQSARFTVPSMLNDGANLTQSLLKRRR